jgi:hypothetical protein
MRVIGATLIFFALIGGAAAQNAPLSIVPNEVPSPPSAETQLHERVAKLREAVVMWIQCQSGHAKGVASVTTETPENIILATFSACGAGEKMVRDRAKQMYSLGNNRDVYAETDKFTADIREASKERLTKEIIDVRAYMKTHTRGAPSDAPQD